MYTRKSLLNFEFFWTKSKFGVRTFFWLSVWEKQSPVFWRKAKSRCFWTWLAFSRKIIFFRFSKRCSEAREQYFWDFLVRTEENKSVKEFVCFSMTDVFVPVSQLSTRDLFYFLENLKTKQDILSWVSRLVRSLDQRALWFPYSRLFFGIVFKKLLILEYLGCLQSQLWCQY